MQKIDNQLQEANMQRLFVWMFSVVAALTVLLATAASARIVCHDDFQVVNGGEIASPYCQDNTLASVARGYGRHVSDSEVGRALQILRRRHTSLGGLRLLEGSARRWQAMSRGEIDRLKPEYRVALAEEGYALVNCELAVFKQEA